MKPVPELTEMAFDMFERMGFLLGESADKADFRPDETAGSVRGEIRFAGDLHGSLNIVTTEKLGRLLASNFLGLDEAQQAKDSEMADAIKEFLNVYCGNILAEITEKGENVDLLVPETTLCSVEYMKGVVHNPESVFVLIEGEPAAFLFTISK